MKDLITEHIDIWTSAQVQKKKGGRGRGKSSNGQSIYGIKKLRELILDLAVRGKLVPQDPDDESARVLLDKVEEEKARLIKEGQIKKQKALSKINLEEKTFQLPKGWEWIKLGCLMEMFNGRAFKSAEWSDKGLPIVRIQNLNNHLAPFNFFDGELFDNHKIGDGTFLISWSGTPGTSFGAFIWNRGEAALNQHINKCLIFCSESNKEFLKLSVNSCIGHLISMAQGGVGLKHVTKGILNNVVFGFPPLAEQHRIVAKVDELIALCDKLEQQQTDSNATHQTLVETLLTTLTNAADQTEFTYTWQRIADHFDTLFTTEQSIDHLKQTILQLAVMGKLVPQDPDDEPASVLLEKIAEGKKRLIQEGKIKRQKNTPTISGDEKLYEIPMGWEWIRLGTIVQELKYGTSKRSDYQNDGEPILRIPNVVKGYIDSNDLKFTELDEKEKFALSLEEGDLLIIRSNGSVAIVGRSAVVDSLHAGFMYAGYLVRVRINTATTNSDFLKIILDSKLVRDQIELPIRTTSGVKNINSTEISGLLIPSVPISEQHRIVAKVDDLMVLCEGLKKTLQATQATQVKLSDSIVTKVLN